MKYLVFKENGRLSSVYGPVQESRINRFLDNRGFEDISGQKGKFFSTTYPGWTASITDIPPVQARSFDEIDVPA